MKWKSLSNFSFLPFKQHRLRYYVAVNRFQSQPLKSLVKHCTFVVDFEKRSSYDLTLTAIDRGSPQQQSSSVTLKVNVVDANDNTPKFNQQVSLNNLVMRASMDGEGITCYGEEGKIKEQRLLDQDITQSTSICGHMLLANI